MEPDTEDQRLVNCVIRNTICENNNGNQFLVYLKPLNRKSEPVSLRFEHCLARMTQARLNASDGGSKSGIKGVAGIAVGEIKDDGPKGLIEFIDCVTEHTGMEGARIYDKSSTSARVRFANCSFSDPLTLPQSDDPQSGAPILLELRRPQSTQHLGGIDFQDCYVYDKLSRAPVLLHEQKGDFGLRDVHGTIRATGPGTAAIGLGTNLHDVDLRIIEGTR